jgi:hypothetical protein
VRPQVDSRVRLLLPCRSWQCFSASKNGLRDRFERLVKQQLRLLRPLLLRPAIQAFCWLQHALFLSAMQTNLPLCSSYMSLYRCITARQLVNFNFLQACRAISPWMSCTGLWRHIHPHTYVHKIVRDFG